jgi:DNA-directed RNA polymerase alpha subunit
MDLDKKANEYNHYPSKYEMEYMSDYELFKLASQNKKFRKMMVSFISSFEFKPIVFIYDEDGKYNVRKIGLSERLKNVLLQNGYHYLSDINLVSSSKLLQMNNFGVKSFAELELFMNKYGFQLTYD